MTPIPNFKLCLAVFIVLFSVFGHSEQGVTEKVITIGQSAVFSGPSAALGNAMKAGAMSYFKKINASGGINGRTINFVSRDDIYEPEKSVENTFKLIDVDKAFFLFGYVGTPTVKVAVPLVDKIDIPLVGVLSGAEIFRDPVNKNIFNIRASYYDETEALVAGVVDELKLKKIGIFLQDDSFGVAVEDGINIALNKRKLAVTSRGVYQRNTIAVEESVKALKEAAPEAIIMAGTYKAVAAFVKQAKSSGLKSKYFNVSFVGTSALIRELGADGDGIYISQVTPSPWDTSVPVVKDYQADFGAKNYDYTSLEGYISAKVAVEALKAAGPKLTRDSFRSALNNLSIDLGGFAVSFKNNHSGSNKVWMSIIKAGKIEPVTKM